MIPSSAPVLCLFGPTAVGKTELLLKLFGGRGEVVVADSLQVYRHLNIGSAKPDDWLRRQLPHHLLDICDPREQFHAGRFVEMADAAIGRIVTAGRRPIVSGGAGFYLRQLLFGLPGTPPSEPATRKSLQARLRHEGLTLLFAELQRLDPESAARIHHADSYRIMRALEVYHISGRPLSSFRPPARPRRDLLLIGLLRPTADLRRRIAARIETMFARGLPAEVQQLLDMGYRPSDPGLRGIGYREFFAGPASGPDAATAHAPPEALQAIKEQIIVNSLRYAKRQRTFFRSLPNAHWLDADDLAGLRRLIADGCGR